MFSDQLRLLTFQYDMLFVSIRKINILGDCNWKFIWNKNVHLNELKTFGRPIFLFKTFIVVGNHLLIISNRVEVFVSEIVSTHDMKELLIGEWRKEMLKKEKKKTAVKAFSKSTNMWWWCRLMSEVKIKSKFVHGHEKWPNFYRKEATRFLFICTFLPCTYFCIVENIRKFVYIFFVVKLVCLIYSFKL